MKYDATFRKGIIKKARLPKISILLKFGVDT